MDSCLTQKVPVSLPGWKPVKVPMISGYQSFTSLTPIIEKMLGSLPSEEGQLAADERYVRVLDFEGNGPCSIETTMKKKRKAFCKVTHLLDPIRTMQAYYESSEKGEARKKKKLENPMNQAYVDGLANYLVGQLRERNISPHFCLFFGAYRAVAELYRYNITEEFDSYRNYKGFWNAKRSGLFQLYIHRPMLEEGDQELYTEQELAELISTPKHSLQSSSFSYSSSSKETTKSHITLEDSLEEQMACVELESISSFPDDGTVETYTSSSDSSDDSKEMIELYAEFKSYPVMLLFQERMEGVLDDMLEDEEEVGCDIGSAEWEERWTVWIFQIIAALCAAQGALGFTHNDLHTSNIVWSETDLPYLYYIARDSTVWKIPTFGKLFRIIDFGRAIFRVGSTWFLSDDYESGGDAEGQYSCFSIAKEGVPDIYPNPSFDLCRFSVSCIDALFPETPVELPDGEILSKEDSWIVRETTSPLWNMLWSWLIADDHANILKDKSGVEKYPDFDLYKEISASVHNAKPQDQIRKTIYTKYIVSRSSIGEWEQIYPLFT